MSAEWLGDSASNVGPMIECAARLALPQVRETGEYAERGNILHEFCRVCTVNPKGRAQALLDIADDKIRATAEGINLDAALDGLEIVACERAYVLNVKDKTVRVAGDDIGRHYDRALAAKGLPPLSFYDVPFTVDVVAMANGVPVELDYKSGMSIGPVDEHWQRRVCAVGLMLHYDTPTAISRVAYIKEDGSIVPDGHEFSCIDIDDFCDEIVEAKHNVLKAREMLAAGRMPVVSPSETACKYCAAFDSCPAQTNLAKALIGELSAIENGPDLSTLSPEQFGRVWDLMKRAEKILGKIEKAGKLYVEERPLIVSDTHQYEQRWQPGNSYFDDARARGEIVRLMGQAGASEEEIQAKLKSLNGKGRDFAKVVKVRRALPVVAEPKVSEVKEEQEKEVA